MFLISRETTKKKLLNLFLKKHNRMDEEHDNMAQNMVILSKTDNFCLFFMSFIHISTEFSPHLKENISRKYKLKS